MKSEQDKNFKRSNFPTRLKVNKIQLSIVEEGLVSQYNYHFEHRLESYDSFYKWLYEFPKLVKALNERTVKITCLNCGYPKMDYRSRLKREAKDNNCAFKCYLFNEYFEIEECFRAHMNDLINTGLLHRDQLVMMKEMTQYDLLETPLPKLRELLIGLVGEIVWEDMCFRYFYKTLSCSPSIIS